MRFWCWPLEIIWRFCWKSVISQPLLSSSRGPHWHLIHIFWRFSYFFSLARIAFCRMPYCHFFVFCVHQLWTSQVRQATREKVDFCVFYNFSSCEIVIECHPLFDMARCACLCYAPISQRNWVPQFILWWLHRVKLLCLDFHVLDSAGYKTTAMYRLQLKTPQNYFPSLPK